MDSTKQFLVSAAFLAMTLFAVFSNVRGRDEAGDLGKITAPLVEWTVLGSQKPLLRFSLEGVSADFRLDPSHFREALDRRVPGDFKRGVSVTVTAKRAELKTPSSPLLSREEIIWVRGIDVDGRVVIDPDVVQKVDLADDRWGYGLLVFSAGFFIYSLVKWQLPRILTHRIP